VSKEDFEALKVNYGTDAIVESTSQVATGVNSLTDGTAVPSADRQVSNSRPGGHCSACVAVLSNMMTS
jgi:hypothetical protein